MEKEKCQNCGECYVWDIKEAFGVGTAEKVIIDCPHCGNEYGSVRTSGVVMTYKR